MVSTSTSFTVYLPILIKNKLWNERKIRKKSQRITVGLLSLLSGIIIPIVSLNSLKHIDVSTYAIIGAFGTVISYFIISILLKKEEKSWVKTIAVIIITTGILIGIGGIAKFNLNPYIFLMLFGLLLSPFLQILRKKAIRETKTITSVLIFTTIVAFITQSSISLINNDKWDIPYDIIIYLVLFGYLKVILKYVYNFLIKKIDITKIMVFSGIKQFLTVILSFLIFGTVIYYYNFIGLFLIFIGIFLFYKKRK